MLTLSCIFKHRIETFLSLNNQLSFHLKILSKKYMKIKLFSTSPGKHDKCFLLYHTLCGRKLFSWFK